MLTYSSEDEEFTSPLEHRQMPPKPLTRSVVQIIDGRSSSPRPNEYTYEDVKESPKLVYLIVMMCCVLVHWDLEDSLRRQSL